MRNFLKKADENVPLRWILLALLSLCFLLMASPYTTPLNRYYGYDSSVFLSFGKAMTHGKRLYIDLYDNKGPMIFCLNALGYLLGGRTGVFALQVVFMTFTFALLYRLGRFYGSPAAAWATVAVCAFLYCGTVGEGDMTEEWSLSFSLLPLVLGLGFMRSGRPVKEHPWLCSLIYGLCLGVQLMLRVTNAAVVAGLLLAFAVLLIKEKSWGALVKNILMVLLGAAAMIAPFVVHYRATGAYDAFIYASLLHNFRYAAGGAAEKTVLDWLYWAARVVMAPVGLVVCASLERSGKIHPGAALTVGCTGVISALVTSRGYSYKHYFLILAPAACAAFAMILGALERSEHKGKKRAGLLAALLAVMLLPYAPQAAVHAGKGILFNFAGYLDDEAASMEEIDRQITDHRDSVLGYNTRCNIYLYLDVDPCFRHCMTQDWMMRDSPFIREELDTLFRTDPPVWVVANKNDRDVERMLTEDYGYIRTAEVSYGLKPALYRCAWEAENGG